MTAKGYVRHEEEGRAYRYYPAVGPEVAGSSALERIREAIYQGSSELLFSQLVRDRKVKRAELERMRKVLNERLEEEP
jgi:predicted transcriptional regulator